MEKIIKTLGVDYENLLFQFLILIVAAGKRLSWQSIVPW